MALHVRYIFLYISLPVSAQQREMTKIQSFTGEREHSWAHEGEFSFLCVNLKAVPTNAAPWTVRAHYTN